jgi:DNA-directed RNA polymerase subunit M/transcription elongation factor TFIIS
MELVQISAIFETLKTGNDIVKSYLASGKDQAAKEKATELTTLILDLQSNINNLQIERTTLLNQINELDEILKKNDEWENIKNDYELLMIEDGIYVYEYKGKNKLKHWACTKCYKDKMISIIQKIEDYGSAKIYKCPECGFKYRITQNGSGSFFTSAGYD